MARRKKSEVERERALISLGVDRRAAHATLFAHRHHEGSADFHGEIIDALHSDHQRVVIEAFRGGAKSTLAEEGMAIGGCYREFENAVIIGSNEDRATERLESIKHEYETNEAIHELFGNMVGQIWQAHKAVLGNDIVIQARGRGQSLRGLKYRDRRPDFCLIDDLEDEDTVKTPEARQEMLRWLYRALLPALTPHARVRFLGNRLDDEAVIVKVSEDPDWKHLRYPIMHRDLRTGDWRAAWPQRFPLDWVMREQTRYERLGLGDAFMQEYMCEATAPESKIFKSEMFKVEPRVRTWEAVWAMYDPARTVNPKSATTGRAVWSWIGTRLVVWDAWGRLMTPSEIIEDMFLCDDEFRPVAIGVEKDGLELWISQPLRQAQMRRNRPLPIREMKAPPGKTQFISSLQPFGRAGEIVFAKDLPEAKAQFLSFPKGKIDVPNALAYALRMRPGLPIYDEFSERYIVEEIAPASDRPLWLCLNATAAYTAAALVQYIDGALRIIADWMREGDPGQVATSIVTDATLEAGRKLRLVAPPQHFDKWTNVGLGAAVARIPAELQRGGDPVKGQGEIRKLFGREVRGVPLLLVSWAARWTCNAFAGGYARPATVAAGVAERTDGGAYDLLMQGIESWAARLDIADDEDRKDANYAFTEDGRRFLSAMRHRA